MNIHKRGIALSGRFCRLEHPSNTHTHTKPTEEDKYLKYESETKHHPRKKTSTSSTNLKPKAEEDKYLKYESETKHHPRRKISTQVPIGNQNTKKEDEDSETQETCGEDSKAYQLRLRNSRHPRRTFINLQTPERRP